MPKTKKKSEAQKAKLRRESMRKRRSEQPVHDTEEEVTCEASLQEESELMQRTVHDYSEAVHDCDAVMACVKNDSDGDKSVKNDNNDDVDKNKEGKNSDVTMNVEDEPGDSLAVVPHQHLYTGVNFTDILAGEAPINVMDLISMRLRTQYRKQHGLLALSYMYAKECAKETLADTEIIPRNVIAVQIHFVNGHYLISCRLPPNIYVIDSLSYKQRVSQLMPQLRLIYEVVNDRRVEQSDVRYYVPQSQGSSVDCGPFAVANAVCILNNVEPASVVLHQRHMRSHIFQCLYNNHFVMFPHSNRLQENESEQLSNKGRVKKRRLHEERVIETDKVKKAYQRKPTIHIQKEQNQQTKPEERNKKKPLKSKEHKQNEQSSNIEDEKKEDQVKNMVRMQNKRSAKTEEEKKNISFKKTVQMQKQWSAKTDKEKKENRAKKPFSYKRKEVQKQMRRKRRID